MIEASTNLVKIPKQEIINYKELRPSYQLSAIGRRSFKPLCLERVAYPKVYPLGHERNPQDRPKGLVLKD
jgi:hypothetical protein